MSAIETRWRWHAHRWSVAFNVTWLYHAVPDTVQRLVWLLGYGMWITVSVMSHAPIQPTEHWQLYIDLRHIPRWSACRDLRVSAAKWDVRWMCGMVALPMFVDIVYWPEHWFLIDNAGPLLHGWHHKHPSEMGIRHAVCHAQAPVLKDSNNLPCARSLPSPGTESDSNATGLALYPPLYWKASWRECLYTS